MRCEIELVVCYVVLAYLYSKIKCVLHSTQQIEISCAVVLQAGGTAGSILQLTSQASHLASSSELN